MLRPVLLLVCLLLASCRDSPKGVVEAATEAAAQGDLAAVQESFSVTTVHRLERAWELAQRNQTEGWRELSEKLTFQGAPLEVLDEKIRGDFARVDARAGVETRDYYLRKEDGRWRIELGAAARWRRAPSEDGDDEEKKAGKGEDEEKKKEAADHE